MYKIFSRYISYMPDKCHKISPIYPKDMTKLRPIYVLNVVKISPRYAQDMLKICPRYAQNMLKICPRYAQDHHPHPPPTFICLALVKVLHINCSVFFCISVTLTSLPASIFLAAKVRTLCMAVIPYSAVALHCLARFSLSCGIRGLVVDPDWSYLMSVFASLGGSLSGGGFPGR